MANMALPSPRIVHNYDFKYGSIAASKDEKVMRILSKMRLDVNVFADINDFKKEHPTVDIDSELFLEELFRDIIKGGHRKDFRKEIEECVTNLLVCANHYHRFIVAYPTSTPMLKQYLGALAVLLKKNLQPGSSLNKARSGVILINVVFYKMSFEESFSDWMASVNKESKPSMFSFSASSFTSVSSSTKGSASASSSAKVAAKSIPQEVEMTLRSFHSGSASSSEGTATATIANSEETAGIAIVDNHNVSTATDPPAVSPLGLPPTSSSVPSRSLFSKRWRHFSTYFGHFKRTKADPDAGPHSKASFSSVGTTDSDLMRLEILSIRSLSGCIESPTEPEGTYIAELAELGEKTLRHIFDPPALIVTEAAESKSDSQVAEKDDLKESMNSLSVE